MPDQELARYVISQLATFSVFSCLGFLFVTYREFRSGRPIRIHPGWVYASAIALAAALILFFTSEVNAITMSAACFASAVFGCAVRLFLNNPGSAGK